MKGIIAPLLEDFVFNSIVDYINKDTFPMSIKGIADTQKAHLIFGLYETILKPCLVIASNDMEAQRVYNDLNHFQPGIAEYFPAKEVVFYDVDAMSNELIGKRLRVIERLVKNEKLIIVTTPDAYVQKLPPLHLLKNSVFSIKIGDEVKLSEIQKRLVQNGYERVDSVDGRGQFAVRGGIIDFYSFSNPFAYRIELFGDNVDSIRKFDVISQRSIEEEREIKIFPVSEFVFEDDKLENSLKNIRKALEITLKENRLSKEQKAVLEEKINEDIEKLEETKRLMNIDRYFTHFYEEWETIADYLGSQKIFFLDSYKVLNKLETTYKEFDETYKWLLEKGTILPDSYQAIIDIDTIIGIINKENTVDLSSFEVSNKVNFKRDFDLIGREIGSFLGFEQLIEQLQKWKEAQYKVVVFAGNKIKASNINQEFRNRELESIYYDDLNEVSISPRQIIVSHGSLSGSFEYPDLKYAVISDKSLFGEDKKERRTARKKTDISFSDLNIGDYVVHAVHGIGQYIAINKLVVDGNTRDYLKIKYSNDDVLYIPTTQMDSIQKYIGSEGKAPRLNKLGGAEWAKTKKKVRESLMDIAAELIAIYAERMSNKGYEFSKDTVWQKQFEEQFPYEETEDQLNSIDEVKRDMESEKVMDRLLCGDVGFGKTEVAIRAAFKAAIEGKQVAYLVPTTVLAQQHFNTFSQRMKDFPINVAMLSRFKTLAEQRKTLRELKNGTTDILIGTHRIIQKDIEFKNLGLLIIDEEQRFGVTHKEKIKRLKSNIDVLTLTATPIPRTLHMAMVGIRDMSVLYEPPEDRYPVQTFVMEYDKEVIRDAIIRELGRGGQVFYLYNRVKSIHKVLADIKNLVPNASVVAAHGQMDSKELEDVMLGFIQGKWNVLVCTSIIESGLDIPNVNTIVIEESDKLGLAQLYQIRGRVGRSNKLAYAYVTYKKDKTLTEEAEKRLKAIRDFTEFGSGFKIAMRDLEIRGAGNLLGAQQHGHMEAVGYDTYCKLLEQAVKELRGEEVKEEIEVQIDLNVNAYISDSYIQVESQKIEMYKKIASINEEKDIEDIEDELIDRYGDIPKEVNNLLIISRIKILAKHTGINLITDKNGMVVFQFKENILKIETIGKLMNDNKGKILFSASTPPYLTYKIDNKSPKKLENIKNILQSLNKLQTENE